MNARRKLCLFAAFVVLGGSAYLSSPSEATAQSGCSDTEWYAAAARARTACGGPASFAGYCANGTFHIETIYCVGAT